MAEIGHSKALDVINKRKGKVGVLVESWEALSGCRKVVKLAGEFSACLVLGDGVKLPRSPRAVARMDLARCIRHKLNVHR